MGAQGTEKNRQRALVLDAGALIAYEQGDRRARAIVKVGATADKIIVPAGVLAQVWRGGSGAAALARLIHASAIDSLDEQRAKEVGVRLGLRSTSDVNDAHVVCCALAHDAKIVTSDSGDIRALAEPRESLALISI